MTIDAATIAAGYRDELLERVLPFWTRHAVDREDGGFLHHLGRDGRVLDTDKGIWVHARFVWMLTSLCRELGPRDEWLALARHGIEFLSAFAFEPDGRARFLVTRDGRPLRRRRYVFSELFCAQAFAGWSELVGDDDAARTALALHDLAERAHETPGAIEPKVDPETRPLRSLATPMILLNTAQELRDRIGGADTARWDTRIDHCIREIRSFVHPEHDAVLEVVGADGELVDHVDGRTLNPGHAIECAWFVLREAERRDDAELLALALTMAELSWRRGWDDEHGGLAYFVDVDGGPVQEYWHDMKFWWPQCEGLVATALAWRATGDALWADRHEALRDWAFERFPDPEHGEWFGYLHRDGRLASEWKGNLWKGPFHVPRALLVAGRALEEISDRPAR